MIAHESSRPMRQEQFVASAKTYIDLKLALRDANNKAETAKREAETLRDKIGKAAITLGEFVGQNITHKAASARKFYHGPLHKALDAAIAKAEGREVSV